MHPGSCCWGPPRNESLGHASCRSLAGSLSIDNQHPREGTFAIEEPDFHPRDHSTRAGNAGSGPHPSMRTRWCRISLVVSMMYLFRHLECACRPWRPLQRVPRNQRERPPGRGQARRTTVCHTGHPGSNFVPRERPEVVGERELLVTQRMRRSGFALISQPTRWLLVASLALTGVVSCEPGLLLTSPGPGCSESGMQCQLPEGPLGVCERAPCDPGETPPCFQCTPQH